MDGNGRWALKRGKNRLFGHRAGVESIKKTIMACLDLNIKIMSIFAFSTENWKRPKEEVDGIFSLVDKLTQSDIDLFVKNGITVRTMGDLTKLPEGLQNSINSLKEQTKNNTKLILNIALNYGGRAEIVRAVNNIIKTNKTDINEDDIKNNLYTFDLPDPDLIIRTSGENRISNFMLFQCAYSEFYFPKIHWPDFNKKQLKKAIKIYQKRNRRFGGLK
ncbi:MAG: di-trans,poly-cis-decaprenylcistransferase [Clostridia bacterium]|nr:di-trans,poly-cis-decaprenylcistransferase [Clostridia bacterium]